MTEPAGGTVQVAYLHTSSVSHSWHESMRRMYRHDREHGHRLAEDPLNIRCNTGRLVPSRNLAVRLFLDDTPHEWLLFVDTDMGFEPDALDRLLAVADPTERPVVGALAFALYEQGYDGAGGFRMQIAPTMYRIGHTKDGKESFSFFGSYPTDAVCQVAATGAAFLLLHRSVLEKVRGEHGDRWFEQLLAPSGDLVGEDFAFCLRVGALGIPINVHTGIRTTHHKEVWIGEEDYLRGVMGALPTPPDVPVHVHIAASLATFDRGEQETSTDGTRTWKLTQDLERYAAAIAACRPDVIVETGTKWGGSARWFEQQGVDVVTVDIDPSPVTDETRAACTRTTWIVGSSLDPEVLDQVRAAVAGRRVMVSLDSEHAAPHVAAEIDAYGPLVTPGCYLVVEDAIFDLATTYREQARGGAAIPHVGGPLHAIAAMLVDNPDWRRDEDIERMHPLSHYPAGWWIRQESTDG